ncbi:O-succinylbenzoic acid-CoA ligase [Brochothrix thermosphacta]|uniref:o-succinylbenzoate--CoA ligase n=1 Tax=Brochothrix thermosphacta TaxID=2756 RepID=UPI000A1B7598|nr:o-succinylbenzoate--CoA ligase [Brochothrix thermosphacta]SLN05649.1 O-succinylbenzoic acid--CoA ligase [Brachybacterium faecium]WKK69709.1 o-succinylbenzoate--CoA ligase [Brochothrix thermosphacta]SPP27602.1 O-succinylbenzoic acid-CoA ligase [Brochothrix thermosphacta]HCZ38081.1 o-succinylbenzoate--CoA ligase [Brochothrix thermosphacta]HCZ46943.1 o-succinylbenzoate--CoA ligase [Brochothrix thermosphacta]
MFVNNWLSQRVEQSPTASALIYDNETTTFRELGKRVWSIAGKLQTVISPGQHVALLGENNRAMYELILALQQIGAVTVFINNRLTASEINYQLEQSDTTQLLYADNFKELVAVLDLAQRPALSFVSLEKLTAPAMIPNKTVSLKATASMMFTSGSTGHPKAVQQTYGNHLASAMGTAMTNALGVGDCWYCAVPLFHISGLSIMMRSLLFGTAVMLEQKFDAFRLGLLLTEGTITHASVVTTMLHRLLDTTSSTYRCHPAVKVVLLGGGPVTKELLAACQERNIPVIPSYGMTETAAQAVAMPLDKVADKLGSAGLPLFQTQLRINKGTEATDTVGDIWLKGANITPGYYGKQSTDFQNGWFRTGDVGYLDNEGFLYVKERAGDLIISGGENIYPTEIEHVLLGHPAIKEIAVVGVPNEQWTQVPVAYIVTDKAVTEAELAHFLKNKLAKYKWPQAYYHVEKLPRTATGKIQRHLLRQQ